MSIQRTRKISDLEKRLKVLNQQLYGKQEERSTLSAAAIKQPFSFNPTAAGTISQSHRNVEDIAYLRYDLTKITILAVAAFGIQFVLYFLIQNHLVNLSLLNLHF